MSIITRVRLLLIATFSFLWRNAHHIVAGVFILIWCLPYFLTGTRLEWGDFSFFAQGSEAIRASILTYHQFPWFNPWVLGGVPLYANPQFGVFSLQTLLGLPLGAVMGLKLALVIYTVGGYASMFLLSRKYFKLSLKISAALGLLWIFSSFFVSHLPPHYTFAWYMLAPLFVYLALTIKTWRGGLVFGLAFAIMGLAQLHYPFVHIAMICATILAVRLFRGKVDRKALLIALGVAAAVFLLIAGHRALFTFENVHEFPRHIIDATTNPIKSLLALIIPFSSAQKLPYAYPVTAFGWGEMTATIGILANIIFGGGVALVWYWRNKKEAITAHTRRYLIALLILSAIICAIGLGNLGWFSPYGLLKNLPLLSDMRVASRWFIWVNLLQLLFIGCLIHGMRQSRYRTWAKALLVGGVLELFLLNVGYQYIVLGHPANIAPKSQTAYQFIQSNEFGDTVALPSGDKIPDDGHLPSHYREYEATTYNMGILHANDALVDYTLQPSPRCATSPSCPFVLSNNATVTYWSPQKIVLTRSAPGKIMLNTNNSNYYVVNGARNADIKAAEPLTDFTLNVADDTKTITLEVKPDYSVALKHILQKY